MLSAGYTALHDAAAWADLSERGKVRAFGRDRGRFLHNLLSNDVRGRAPGQGGYHFVLNAQGRIQADANLYVFPDYILLDCEPELTGRLLAHLRKYIIADDVRLEEVTPALATVALEGPRVEEVAGGQLAPESHAHREDGGVIVSRTSLTGQPGLWFFLDPSRKAELVGRLERSGATAATADDVRTARVENGRPRCGEDFGDSTLPQETQQERALSFTKGCYLGQEIVERIRSRGQVHRLLVRLAVDGQELPEPGSGILAGEQHVGKLTSPVYSPRMGRVAALGIIRREFATAGTALTVAERRAEVLPMKR